MIVVMKTSATKEEIDKVRSAVSDLGYSPHPIEGILRTVIAVVGDERGKPHDLDVLKQLQGVDKVVPVVQPYKLTSREINDETSVIDIEGVTVGSSSIPIVAGPCSVENEEQIMTIATSIRESGASMIRGGAFKPRTSPYSFQGLGKSGLELLRKAKETTGLPIVTEIVSPDDLELVEEYADVLQIGARNSQNYALLKYVGRSDKAVLLKRGMSTTINEFLMCAEYILSEGNSRVMLCERGIRTFETATRNTFDLNAIPVSQGKNPSPCFC